VQTFCEAEWVNAESDEVVKSKTLHWFLLLSCAGLASFAYSFYLRACECPMFTQIVIGPWIVGSLIGWYWPVPKRD